MVLYSTISNFFLIFMQIKQIFYKEKRSYKNNLIKQRASGPKRILEGTSLDMFFFTFLPFLTTLMTNLTVLITASSLSVPLSLSYTDNNQAKPRPSSDVPKTDTLSARRQLPETDALSAP